MTLCPPDCPERRLHCHRTCQRYNRARVKQLLTAVKRSRKLTDEADFYREEHDRIIVRKLRQRPKYGQRE
ncbi:MAG: hypothetical protein PUK20_03895 [Firmicutes bacterium]|nr:hypothetical protein [Bacillota bacterium]MDY4106789.1 hypothetical protein [Oscillospiraceae bacterium]